MKREATFRDAANYQHGRSRPTPVPCPDCGAPLDVDERADTLNPTTGDRGTARVAFCTGCEFVHCF